MPRVFFAMLPVFAGIVALLYRGWTFPTSLVFAAHVHAFAFVVFTASEAIKFTGSRTASIAVGVAMVIALAVYVVMAFRAVFGGRILTTVGKVSAIALLYLLTSLPAFFVILMWAAIS